MKMSAAIKAALIGGGAVIIAAVITGLFSLGEQDKQINQSGNKNIYSEDHIEGDKIVNIGPSKTDIENIIKKAAKEFEQSLSNKYPGGHIVFGVKEDGFVVPKGVVPEGVEIDWTSGKVVSVSENRIEVLLPDMMINNEQFKNLQVSGNVVGLPKKMTKRPMSVFVFGKLHIQVEVLGIDKGLIIAGLGFN